MKDLILQAVENQIKENNPPETKETFDRLIDSGYGEQTAKEMIGAVVVENLYFMLKEKKEFDKDKYVNKLRKLE